MSRPPRIEFAGAVHHVMARGDRREEIFRDDRDRSKFLGYLAEGAERYRVKVHCYVLMENHFHLVATTPEGNLSKWMHQLKTAYRLVLEGLGISSLGGTGLIGEIEDPFEAVKWQQVLGGEGFLRQLKDHWNQRVERPKNSDRRETGQLLERSRP